MKQYQRILYLKCVCILLFLFLSYSFLPPFNFHMVFFLPSVQFPSILLPNSSVSFINHLLSPFLLPIFSLSLTSPSFFPLHSFAPFLYFFLPSFNPSILHLHSSLLSFSLHSLPPFPSTFSYLLSVSFLLPSFPLHSLLHPLSPLPLP